MHSLKQKISQAFDSVLGPKTGLQASLSGVAASKLYEARVLAELLALLGFDGYQLQVVNGKNGLKASPGPINPHYAHIEVRDGSGGHVANIWTDVEFVGLSSYKLQGYALPTATGEYHELDIVVCDPHAKDRPKSNQVYIGVEAKHWQDIPKKLLREILGVRRELSLCKGSGYSNPITMKSFRPVKKSNPDSILVFAFSTPYGKGAGPCAEWLVPAVEFDLELWNCGI